MKNQATPLNNKEQGTPKPDSALKSFLSGGIGGSCSILIGHPLDLVKVRIQTATHGSQMTVYSTLKQTLAKDGISGLYRGVSAPLVAITPMFAVSFWGYDMGKRCVRLYEETLLTKSATYANSSNVEQYQFSLMQLCIAGGISALPTTLIMAPSERLKCLLQVQANEIEKGGTAKYNGLVDCARQVYKEGGVKSIFKGTTATLLRDFPGSVAWFGTYEFLKREFTRIQNASIMSTTNDDDGGQKSIPPLAPLAILSAGGFAGMACWAVSMPMDVIKSRLQSAPEGTYTGFIHVYRDLISKEGNAALFKGIRPAMIRAFPANAACFFGMEVSKEALAFMD